MRLTLNTSRCQIDEQTQTRTGEVDRLTVCCAVRMAPDDRWLPGQVRTIIFTGDTAPLFGFNGPWEVRAIQEALPDHRGRLITFDLRALIPSDVVTRRTQDAEDDLGNPRASTPSLDRLAVEELLQEMQDTYPRPYSIDLATSVDGVGDALQLNVDTRRDTLRFTVAGREVTTTLTALLGALLDPDTVRSVSLPTAPRPRGRRRRRAMAGRE